MKMPPVQHEYIPLAGGLDQVTPFITTSPGTCRIAQNYELSVLGGYRTVEGYERVDGRPAPSAAVFVVLPVSFSASVSVGDTVTGDYSLATGVVIAVESTAIVITKLTGTFTSSEEITVTGVTKATMTGEPRGFASSVPLKQEYLALAAAVYRADIEEVPGSGSVLGVWAYTGEVYAFRNNAGGTAAVMHKATSSGWSEVSTAELAPDGRYAFTNYNFGTGQMMYGADGKNKAFQFDGTTFTQITTGMTTDTPTHICAHSNHLFLSFEHSVQHSPIGDPTGIWTAVTGAGEINIGDTVTNMLPQPGNAEATAMTIFSRNGSFVLYGTASDTWKLVTLNSEAGARAYTGQTIGATYGLDDRGVTATEATQAYGNFASASVSDRITPWLVEYQAGVTGATVSRSKSQYRLFFGEGRALYLTVIDAKPAGFMPMRFPHSFNAVYSIETNTGVDVTYAAGTDGFVYQLDKGTSFDGAEIESFLSLQFNPSKSVRVMKQFRRAIVETSGVGFMRLFIGSSLGYGSPDIESNTVVQNDFTFGNAYWDNGAWDEGVWDGQGARPIEHDLTGTSENISMGFTQVSDSQPTTTIHGVVLHFTARRQLR